MRIKLLITAVSFSPIVLYGGVQITTSLVYPRIDIKVEEEMLSRARVVLNNNLGKIGDVRVDFEYGSPAISQQDRLRIYILRVRMKVGSNHRVEAGRLTEWSPLYIARVDGVRAFLKLKSFGTLSYLGGVISSNDFSSEGYSIDNNAHYLEWKTKVKSNRYSLNGWIVNNEQSARLFSGFSFYQKLLWNITSTGYLSWDFDEAQIRKVRVRLYKKLQKKHTLFIEYRYRSLSESGPYPWVKKNISPRPLLSLGLTSKISPNILWTNTILKRAIDAKTSTYFRSTFQWSKAAISIITERQNSAESTGGTFSVNHDLSNSLSIGGSASYRSYSFSEESDGFSTTGLYGWVKFQPNSQFHLRFTTQLYQNRFFKQDGRAGLSLSYAI